MIQNQFYEMKRIWIDYCESITRNMHSANPKFYTFISEKHESIFYSIIK